MDFLEGGQQPPPPPPTTPLCPCDRHTINNIIPICPLCNQGILQYCILTPSDKPCGLIKSSSRLKCVYSVQIQKSQPLLSTIVQPTLKMSHHKQNSMSSVSRTYL